MPTAIWRMLLESGIPHCDLALALVKRGRGEGEGSSSKIYCNHPHMTGWEQRVFTALVPKRR